MPAHDHQITDFQQHQRAFTQWIRHPNTAPIPDQIESRRMQTYRDLIFNNVSSFIEHTYPITQAMLPSETWAMLIDNFFKYGQCDSPYYYDISLHFREFLNQEPQEEFKNKGVEDTEYKKTSNLIQQTHHCYPWLKELLQYEWMALYVDMTETLWLDDTFGSKPVPEPTLLKFKMLNKDIPITLKTTCWVLAYQYPVHTWSQDNAPARPEIAPTCLLIFRNQDFQMRVFSLHPLWAYLIELIQTKTACTIHHLIQQLSIATQYTEKASRTEVKALIKWLLSINLFHIQADSLI
ncbi:HvfC family RiPP maturation protein [Aquirhabdus parva]|nr:putative DNA-binding domain-containing protein [Aquirhabdus parva]